MSNDGRITRLILDSAQRHSGTSQNCSFVVPSPGIIGRAYEVVRLEIPHTFYNITAANNVINWTTNTPTATVTTIPVGDYSITALMSEIGTQMSADTDDGLIYSCSENTVTKKLTITNSGLSNFELNWGTTISERFAKMLGFGGVSVNTDIGVPAVPVVTGAATYTGNNVYWVGLPKNLYLKSNIANKSDEPSAMVITPGGGNTNIIHKIQVSTVFGESIIFEPNSVRINKLNNQPITHINFQLLDDNFEEIDLNGNEWGVELLFHL